MKRFFILLCIVLSIVLSSSAYAGPWLKISATNGIVYAYYTSPSSSYMLYTARIFDRANGTTINCFGLNSEVNIVAVPLEGYIFDYWSGSTPLTGIKTKFILTGDQEYEAHFKAIDAPPECPECPECPTCPACVCPDIPACPACVCAECPTPEPCAACPECVCPTCPEIPPCPEAVKCKDDEGLCFIKSLK